MTPDPAAPLTHADLEAAVASAVTKALHAQREWMRDVVQEALESAAHDEAIREAEFRAALRDPRRGFPAHEGRA